MNLKESILQLLESDDDDIFQPRRLDRPPPSEDRTNHGNIELEKLKQHPEERSFYLEVSEIFKFIDKHKIKIYYYELERERRNTQTRGVKITLQMLMDVENTPEIKAYLEDHVAPENSTGISYMDFSLPESISINFLLTKIYYSD